MNVVLIAGLWLDANAWDEVLPGLQEAGHRPIPVMLPGQGDGSSDATLDDQVDAVLRAVDAADGPVLVVGHSAAATLAWLAADRRLGRVAGVAMIGGMPQPDGQAYAPWFDVTDGAVPFPGWEPFAGPDSDDLDASTRDRIAADSHPVPEGVVNGIVRYATAGRYLMPTVLICPEFSPEDARGWIEGGETPELAAIQHLSLVDIDSGHWPMFSRPRELARVIAAAADGVASSG